MLSCSADKNCQGKGFLTPPATWRTNRNVPVMPGSEKKPRRSPQARADLFHVIHKVPAGDSPYVRAKHVQLIDKDPSRAISLFWSAINSGDRVDSALKDMAVVMKQLDRSDEAIEAIKSFRHLCPAESQESLDNVLVELYKKSGRIEEEIEMLQLKLRHIEEGIAFGGKQTKMARSQGKKVNITIEKEYSRLLGNLAWAYVQHKDYKSAEVYYRKALSLEPDKNKQCNLAICLMHMNKITEARFLLRAIRLSAENGQMDEAYAKSYERAAQMMDEIESQSILKPVEQEKEIGEEVLTPVTNRKLKGLSTPHGEDQINAFRSVTSRSLSDGNLDRKLPMGKWNRGSCNWNLQDDRTNLFYTDRGTSQGTSFCSRRDDNFSSTGLMEVGSACKKAYTSPFPAGGIPRVPYTQPRRTSWSFKKGDQSRGWLAERAVGDCSRKLSFEQPTNNNPVQCAADSYPNKNLQIPAIDMPKAVQLVSELHSPFGNSDDWGKKRWENCAKAYSEDAGRQSTCNGEWKENSLEYDKQKSAMQDCILPSDSLSPGTNPGENEQPDGDFDRNSNFPTEENGGLKEIVEHTLENLKSVQQIDANLKPHFDFSIYKSKKSWADMVEEDEQELQSAISNFADEERATQYQELFETYPISSKSSNGWEVTEGFNDENTDCNIILGTPIPLNQPEKVTGKIESSDLKGGYYTQPGNAASSMSRAVRRTLCFDKDQKPDRADSYCASPLQKKALNFDSNASMLSDGCTSSNGIKLLRRNRLQVFRDITPESPRA